MYELVSTQPLRSGVGVFCALLSSLCRHLPRPLQSVSLILYCSTVLCVPVACALLEITVCRFLTSVQLMI